MQPKRYALIFDIKKGLKNNENIEFVTEDFGTNVIDVKIENEYGQNYDLSGTIPRLMVKTPSGVPYQRDMIPTNHIAGLCEINLPQEMFTEVGTHTAEIQIWDEATNIIRTTLKQFTYKVRASLQTPEAVEADNNFSLIQSVIANANTATEKAISAAQKAEDIVIGEGVVMETEKGVPNGIATLDENGKIPSSQIPSGSGGGSSNAIDISYDNTVSTLDAENVQDAIDELFQYASDGKIKIATAITGKGVPTSSSDSFTQMATNIDNIEAISTDDATATPGSILLNDTAYVKGVKLLGTMPNNGAVTITPGAIDKPIALGYHNGLGKVVGDPNLIHSNILSGKSIFGVDGTLVAGSGFKKATGIKTDGKTKVLTVSGLTFTPTFIGVLQEQGQSVIGIYDATISRYGWTRRDGPRTLYSDGDYVNSTGFRLTTDIYANLKWIAIE